MPHGIDPFGDTRTRPLAGSAVGALEEWRDVVTSCGAPTGAQIAVVALQNRFWMEWAVFAAHRMYAMGYRPVILYSQREVDQAYRWDRQTATVDADFWERALACRYLTFRDLDAQEPSNEVASYDDVVDRSAKLAVAYALGIEEGEGDALGHKYAHAMAYAADVLRDLGPRVEVALAQAAATRVVCPSGLIGWSAMVMEAARRLTLPAMFVETFTRRPGHLVWNMNRPAVDVDVHGWWRVAAGWDAAKERDVAALAAFHERRSTAQSEWPDNSRVFQRSGAGALPERVAAFLLNYPRPALAGPNIVADSATLGRATIFRSQQAWMREVIAFFLQRPSRALIIRAHPAELDDQPTCRIGDLARGLAGDAPNVLVIDGQDPISTYSIIERCALGLVWVSNVGVDMIIRRRPVLVAAAAHYAPLGICYTARTREQYFELLEEFATHPPIVDEQTVQAAKLYQWIFLRRMSLEATSRTYQTSDYRMTEWMHLDQRVFYQILTGELPVRS